MQEDTSVYAFVTVTIGVCLGEKDEFDEQNLTPKQVIVQADDDHSLHQATPDDLPVIDIHQR